MTSTPKILNSPSSRRSARCSCWPLGPCSWHGGSKGVHLMHRGGQEKVFAFVAVDSQMVGSSMLILFCWTYLLVFDFPFILFISVTCDLLYFLIYAARLLITPGESAPNPSQRQPITPSASCSCPPEESAPQADPETTDHFALALQLF